jgi:hypothetical protein
MPVVAAPTRAPSGATSLSVLLTQTQAVSVPWRLKLSGAAARLRAALPHPRAPHASAAGVGMLGLAAAVTAFGAVSCAGPDTPAGSTVQAAAGAGVGAGAEKTEVPQPGCRVEYRTRVDTGGQFIVDVIVANTGAAALPHWALAFDYGGDQRILSVTGAQSTQDGGAVRLEAATPLAAGGTATVSLVGSYAAGNPMPSGFELAGERCTEQLVGAAAPAPTVTGNQPANGGPGAGAGGPARGGPGAGPAAGGPVKPDKGNSGPGKKTKPGDDD